MSMHDTQIKAALAQYLRRRAMPRAFHADQAAQHAEVAALARIVKRGAPLEGFDGWWQSVTDSLDAAVTHRGWPNGHELAKAMRAVSPAGTGPGTAEIDPDDIAARRIRGEIEGGVGEDWLFGPAAARIVAKGLVAEGDLDRWREGSYAARWEQYGANEADEWLIVAQERHAAAVADLRQQRQETAAGHGRPKAKRPRYTPGAYRRAIGRVAGNSLTPTAEKQHRPERKIMEDFA
jgi:hypothetical protein